jgi:hypothetical protein
VTVRKRPFSVKPIARSCPNRPLDLVGVLVFHNPDNLADQILGVASPAQQMKPQLHARRDPAGGDDPAGVDDAGAADLTSRRKSSQPVDRDLFRGPGLDRVGLFAAGRGEASSRPIFA